MGGKSQKLISKAITSPRRRRIEGEVIIPSTIKNKEKRSTVYSKLKHDKKLEKVKKVKARDASEKRALELGKEPPPIKISKTIEKTKESDYTVQS